jgi:hypothetical protein
MIIAINDHLYTTSHLQHLKSKQKQKLNNKKLTTIFSYLILKKTVVFFDLQPLQLIFKNENKKLLFEEYF